MTDIRHEIRIRAPRATVFEAIGTADGLASWHAASVDGTGAVGTEWVVRSPGKPEFRWLITTSEETDLIRWTCVGGPGDAAGTTASFTLSDTDDGRTLLEHTHADWPGPHGNFVKCNTLWGVLLHHLQQYVETGRSATPFDE